MNYVKFETTLERPIAELPQLDGMVGRKVEIIVLDPRNERDPPAPPAPLIGTAKGKIWMSPDFDAPLDEFKDYT